MKNLAILLGKSEAETAVMINKLEAKTGYESRDVRFLADHQATVRQKISELGLDPNDTTGQELYQALQAKFQIDSDLLDKNLGINTASDKLATAQKLLSLSLGKPEAWALKKSSLKVLLRQLPPKKALKSLGYRSLESMLRREELGRVVSLARQIESSSWQQSFNKLATKLPTSSYEMRPVEFIEVSGVSPAVVESLSGAVAVRQADHSSVLSLSLFMLEELEKICPQINVRSLAKASPSLAWWNGLESSASLHEDRSVSLNIKDVAHNFANKISYYEQVSHRAADAMMQKLTDIYQVPAFEEAMADNFEAVTKPSVRELAAEALEI